MDFFIMGTVAPVKSAKSLKGFLEPKIFLNFHFIFPSIGLMDKVKMKVGDWECLPSQGYLAFIWH